MPAPYDGYKVWVDGNVGYNGNVLYDSYGRIISPGTDNFYYGSAYFMTSSGTVSNFNHNIRNSYGILSFVMEIPI